VTDPTERKRAQTILQRLRKAYPDAHCELNHRNAFELLIATILSAQCTDAKVNEVTATLFGDYPSAEAFAHADPAELEARLRPTGTFRIKAARVREVSRLLLEHHGGEVPRGLDDLLALPGVARKTANVVLGTAFGIAAGVVVDTHVQRLAGRMGLSYRGDPDKIELDLMGRFSKSQWIALAHTMQRHGRHTCSARKPLCSECCVEDLCPKVGVVPPAEPARGARDPSRR
jgi:endonuclease-3